MTLLTKLWISPFFFFAKQYLRLLNILANLIFTPVAFEESFGFFLYPTWPNLVTLFPEDLLLLFSSRILHPKYQALLLAGSSWASEYLCTMGIFGCFSSENAFNHFRFYHWFLTIFGESYNFSTILDNFLVILWVFSFTVGLFFGTFNRVCFAVGLFWHFQRKIFVSFCILIISSPLKDTLVRPLVKNNVFIFWIVFGISGHCALCLCSLANSTST